MLGVQTILAIETSVPEASMALWSEGEWLFEENFPSDRNHNSTVFEPMAKALELLGNRKLSAVVVGTGPGSYSGVRIGIAAAQGMAIARSCPAVGLGSLAATPIARMAQNADGADAIALGDARRGLFYVAPIVESGEAAEPELMDAEALELFLANRQKSALFTLDDPRKLPFHREGGEGVPDDLIAQTRPEARLLIDVWLGLQPGRREELMQEPLAPTYLRAPFTSQAKPGHPLLRKS